MENPERAARKTNHACLPPHGVSNSLCAGPRWPRVAARGHLAFAAMLRARPLVPTHRAIPHGSKCTISRRRPSRSKYCIRSDTAHWWHLPEASCVCMGLTRFLCLDSLDTDCTQFRRASSVAKRLISWEGPHRGPMSGSWRRNTEEPVVPGKVCRSASCSGPIPNPVCGLLRRLHRPAMIPAAPS